MRIHKDGYIQCRQIQVWIPLDAYRRATNSSRYRNTGLENEIEQYLDVELSGALVFRTIERDRDMVLIQIDSDWVQPTRS